MTKKNTLSILENIKKKLNKLDEPRKTGEVGKKDFSDVGDEFEYIDDNHEEEHAQKPAAAVQAEAAPKEGEAQVDHDVMLEHEIENSFEAEDELFAEHEEETSHEHEEEFSDIDSHEEAADEFEHIEVEDANEVPKEPAKQENSAKEEDDFFKDLDSKEGVQAAATKSPEPAQPKEEAHEEEDIFADLEGIDDSELHHEEHEAGHQEEEHHDEFEEIHDEKHAEESPVDEVHDEAATAEKTDNIEDELFGDLGEVAQDSTAEAPAQEEPHQEASEAEIGHEEVHEAEIAHTEEPKQEDSDGSDLDRLLADDSHEEKHEDEHLQDWASSAAQIHGKDSIEKTEIHDEQVADATKSFLKKESIDKASESMKKLFEAKNAVSSVNSFTKSQDMSKIAMEMLEPRLDKWLNDHLPEIVDKIVREEIKKIMPQ